jgi:chaperonin cofactor prefoldin
MTEEIERKIESLNLSRQNAEKRLEDTKENLRKDYQN